MIKTNLGVLIFVCLFIQFSNLHSQNREYKFLNDYIKMKTEELTDSSFVSLKDTFYFELEHKFSSKGKEYHLSCSYLNKWLDSLKIKKKLNDGNIEYKWKKDKINYPFFIRSLNDVKPSSNGFIYIAYFTISKPIFYKNYVFLTERGGWTCLHQSTQQVIYEWEENTGKIIAIRKKITGISSPCFR